MDVSTVELREGRLPLVVSPKEGSDSVHFLKSWISANKEWLDVKLLEYGNRRVHSSVAVYSFVRQNNLFGFRYCIKYVLS